MTQTIDHDRDEAIAMAISTARAEGGGFSVARHKAPGIEIPKTTHVGPIHSPVAGRTDHLPTEVQSGSYVLPADIVSGLGSGNTIAGFRVLKRVFGGVPYSGGSNPYGVSGGPYGSPAPHKSGGHASSDQKTVPVVMAGGEHVLSPDQVRQAGGGDLELGHKVLDEFVKRQRALLVKTLKHLPGPAR